jgi:uncharacterized membrane protein YbhN (UPF0104 family)
VIDEIRTATESFWHFLSDIALLPLFAAICCHLLKLCCTSRAWRNVLAAAYPDRPVRWPPILAAYVAGVGVNAIVPARAGDVLKLYLVHDRVQGTTYPTLGATLIVETLFDMVVAGAILAWALGIGVLPGLDVIPNLPQVDWSWPLNHKREFLIIAAVWITVLALFAVIGIRRAREFKERVRQGFAIFSTRWAYLTQVVSWQALSWGFRFMSVYFFLKAFTVPATLHNALLVLVVQSLSTLFPFTPGGVGTQQGFLLYVFRRAGTGVSGTLLLSFSVGMYIAVTIENVVVGFIALFLMLGTVRWRRVVSDEEEAYARGP